MARERFTYNTQTLRYEKVVEPLSKQLLRIVGFVCAAIVTVVLLTPLSHKLLPSPELQAKKETIEKQHQKITEIQTELDDIKKSLLTLQDRDATAHRMIFGMPPIDQGVWEAGIGGHDKYEHIEAGISTDQLKETLTDLDKIKWQIALQSMSLDTILEVARSKEDMLASIPSIKPVRSDKLARDIKLLSGFGMRMHPIHKVRKMHEGIDFTAPRGTPILATGKGKVIRVERKKTGYGTSVMIDHGYGYKTLYGHMHSVDVKVGQEVKKGQKIGTIGSTGTSTAPHCHYEVSLNGKKVNPIHYCMDGLSPEEYQMMATAASQMNQSFD
jgi:murein DD-endopeptidase MepM/ murein hydrolase activator NlpD